MKPALLFLALAALGNMLYHLGQKSLPTTGNPMHLLMVSYGLSFVMAVLASPFFADHQAPFALGRVFSGPVLLLAVGTIVIEIGFLMAYRSGGSLQWSGAAVNGMAALVLIPLAVAFFRESLSLPRILGIGFTLLGLYLMMRPSPTPAL